MTPQRPAHLLALVLLLPTALGAASAGSAPAPLPDALAANGDPFGQLVWPLSATGAASTGSPVRAAMDGAAAAGLAYGQLVSDPDASPSTALRGLAPMLDARERLTAALAGHDGPRLTGWDVNAASPAVGLAGPAELVDALGQGASPRAVFDRAVETARTLDHTRSVGADAPGLGQIPHFDGPVQAGHAFYASLGAEVPADVLAELQLIADGDPSKAQIITRGLEASVFLNTLPQPGAASGSAPASASGGPSLALMAAARDRVGAHLLDALTAFQSAVAPPTPPTPAGTAAKVGPNIRDCRFGLLVDHDMVDNLYDCDARTVIDLGGDDLYENNGGGGGIQVDVGGTTGIAWNAVALDVGGNDLYTGANSTRLGRNGGGTGGIGVLVEGGGNDRYHGNISLGSAAFPGPRGAINGGSAAGAGLLLDLSGNDLYSAFIEGNGGVNGGANQGSALLVDLAGDDVYQAVTGASDRLPEDRSEAGLNGGANLGVGVLVDALGNDVYNGTVFGHGAINGAGLNGVGVLLDGAGDDEYTGGVEQSIGAVNGAAVSGLGLLADLAGNNFFRVGAGGANVSHGAAGSLAPTEALNEPPLAIRCRVDAPCPGGGLGILLSGPGTDTFRGAGATMGAGHRFGLGVLVNIGGSNDYTAGPGGLAQGSGAASGIGLLVDRGLETRFTLLDDVDGQGSARQGVGLLLRTNPAIDATTVYDVATTASPLGFDGGGVGVRLDLGAATQVGTEPVFACTGSAELARVRVDSRSERTLDMRLCAPDHTTARNVSEPISDDPVTVEDPTSDEEPTDGTVWKPGADCAAPGVDAACSAVENALGPSARAWLERGNVTSTTSGGMIMDHLRRPPASMDGPRPPPLTRITKVMDSADETCEFYCQALDTPFHLA